ncbi:MAG: hypothetical protein ACKOH8_06685, partial [Gemmatimonadota bacterium]
MITWGLAALIGVVLTGVLYRGELSRGTIALPILRWVGVTAVVAALFDAPIRRAVSPRPVVALDVSASWIAGEDDVAWRAAGAIVDSLLDGHADALRLFG